jgi:hypothetical protein
MAIEDFKLVVADGAPPKARDHNISRKPAASSCRFDDPSDRNRVAAKENAISKLSVSFLGEATFLKNSSFHDKKAELTMPEWNYSVNDKVQILLNSQWMQGTVVDMTNMNIPVVRLSKKLKGSKSEYSPSDPTDIKIVDSLPEEPKIEQGSLFF